MGEPENIKGIVVAWLTEHGYDGLMCRTETCGCTLADIMACDCSAENTCVAAYRHECRRDCCPDEQCDGRDWSDNASDYCMRTVKP